VRAFYSRFGSLYEPEVTLMEAKKSKIMRKLLSSKSASSELVKAIRKSALRADRAYTVEVDGEIYVVKTERRNAVPHATRRPVHVEPQ
jgi:hypothetical protein